MSVSSRDVQLKISAQDHATPQLNAIKRSMGQVESGAVEFAQAVSKLEGGGKKAAEGVAALHAQFQAGSSRSVEKLESVMEELNRTLDQNAERTARTSKGLVEMQARMDALSSRAGRFEKIAAARKEAAEAEKADKQARAASIKENINDANVEKRALNEKIKKTRELIAVRKADGKNPLKKQTKDLADLRAQKAAIDVNIKARKEELKEVQALGNAQIKYNKTLADQRKNSAALRGETIKVEKAQSSMRHIQNASIAIRHNLEAGAAALTRASAMSRMGPAQLITEARSIPADATRYVSGYQRLASATRNLGTETRKARNETRGLEDAIGGLTHKFMGLATAYTLFHGALRQIGGVIDVYRSIQAFNSRMAFANEGDFRKTAQDLDYVREAAEKYGVTLIRMTEDYSRFAVAAQSSGLSRKDSKTVFDGLMSAARVNKLTDENISRSIYALQQMVSKGKVSAEELRLQLGESLPGAVTMFARSLGYTVETMGEFYKALELGSIMSHTAVVQFGDYLNNQYTDALAEAANSFEAHLARYRNAIFEAREAFANSGFMEGLTEAMQDLSRFYRSDEGKRYFVELGQSAGQLIKVVGALTKNLPMLIEVAKLLMVIQGAKMVQTSVGRLGASISDARDRRASAALAGAAVGAAAGGMATSAGAAGMARAAAGTTALGAAATRTAAAVSTLAAAGRGFLAVLGGWPGVVLAAGFALFSMNDRAKSIDLAKQIDQIDRFIQSLRDVRIAAGEAGLDFEAFSESEAVRKLRDMSDSERSDILKGAHADVDRHTRAIEEAMAREFLSRQRRLFKDATRARYWMESLTSKFLDEGDNSSLQLIAREGDLITARINGAVNSLRSGKISAKEFADEMDWMVSAGIIKGEFSAEIIRAAAAMEDAKDAASETRLLIKGVTGDTEALAEVQERNNDAEAVRMKEIEDSNIALKQAADIVNGMASSTSEYKRGLDMEAEFRKLKDAADEFREKMSKVIDSDEAQRLAARMVDVMNAEFRRINLDAFQNQLKAIGLEIRGLTPAVAELIQAQMGGLIVDTSAGPHHVRGRGTGASGEIFQDGAWFKSQDAVAPGLTDVQHALLNAIALRESGKRYNVRFDGKGGSAFALNGHHPRQKVRLPNGLTSDAAGRYQFLNSTWQDRTGGIAFTPENQDIAARDYAEYRYKQATGRDLWKDLEAANGDLPDHIMRALGPAWEAFTKPTARAASRTEYQETFRRRQSMTGEDEVSRIAAGETVPQRSTYQAGVDMAISVNTVSAIAKNFGEQASEALMLFVAQNPNIRNDLDFIKALESGNVNAIMAAMRAAGFDDLADKFRDTSVLYVDEQRIRDILDANKAIESELQSSRSTLSSAQLTDPAKYAEAIRTATAEVAAKAVEKGVSLAQATGQADEAAALQHVQSQVTRIAQLELEKQIAEENRKQAENVEKVTKERSYQIMDLREQAKLNAITDPLERDTMRVEMEIEKAARSSEVAWSAAQAAEYREARMAELAEQRKKDYERIQKEKDDEAKKASDERLKRLTDIRDGLDQRKQDLTQQLQWAVEDGDIEQQAKLREEIEKITEEYLKAVEAVKAFHEAAGGEGSEKAIAEAERITAATQRANLANADYRAGLQYTADVMTNAVVGALDQMFQSIVEGESVWSSLATAIRTAVGRILVDMGMMILRAIIAHAILSALGMASGGGAGAAVMRSIGAMSGGRMPVGVHHDGGIVGQPRVSRDLYRAATGLSSSERFTILEVGEEVLTRNDPRHRNNIRIRRYHTGGIVGLGPDALSANLASTDKAREGMLNTLRENAKNNEVNVRNVNLFNERELADAMFSGGAGDQVILNRIASNPGKFRKALGIG